MIDKELISVYIYIGSALIGQLIGIGSAIYYWNKNCKDSVDIFYMLTIYWFVIPFFFWGLLPVLPLVLIGCLIKYLRNK